MYSSGYRLSVPTVSSFLLALICASVLLLIGSATAWGQTATGSIVGVVTDPSGASVVNAEVKLTDPSTNSSQSAKTNEVGRYTFPTVAPGTYDVMVTATGFTQTRMSAQKVDVGESLTLNVTLQVGATSTVVEVQATAGAELQTLNATVGSTITNESLNLMPNLGRDASTLSVLQVGVSPLETSLVRPRIRTASNSMAATTATTWLVPTPPTRPAMATSGTGSTRWHAHRRDSHSHRKHRRIQGRNQRSDRRLQRRRRQPGPDGHQARNQCVPRRAVRILFREQRRRGQSVEEQSHAGCTDSVRLTLRCLPLIGTASAALSAVR